MPEFQLFDGDCLDVLPGLGDKSVDCVVIEKGEICFKYPGLPKGCLVATVTLTCDWGL